jgi:hypothetical protein
LLPFETFFWVFIVTINNKNDLLTRILVRHCPDWRLFVWNQLQWHNERNNNDSRSYWQDYHFPNLNLAPRSGGFLSVFWVRFSMKITILNRAIK